MPEHVAKSAITPTGILVEFTHSPPKGASRVSTTLYKKDTPVVVQALLLSNQGYGTVEDIYAVLAPSQGLHEPLSDSDRDVLWKLGQGMSIEQIIAEQEQVQG